ncbi:hypothetical protein [Marinobacter arenosus]|uniref:hypothetical protein n=1 Tax=Marinobacter arenosus TaxID=2856822 RepID=UPI001C4BC404|nr:hypothetical protein [Marinobacter arenosus]MBW0149083.1 hypothetical protein [Marinobacter arenosus]
MEAVDRLEFEIKRQIDASKRCVFKVEEFQRAQDDELLLLAIQNLVHRQQLAHIGEGLYAKARENLITGNVMLDAEGGFAQVCAEALTLLNIKWQPSKAQRDYDSNLSNQIPTRAVFAVQGKRYPAIRFGKLRIQYEESL